MLVDKCPECGAPPTERALEDGNVVGYRCWQFHVWGVDEEACQGLIDGLVTWRQQLAAENSEAVSG